MPNLTGLVRGRRLAAAVAVAMLVAVALAAPAAAACPTPAAPEPGYRMLFDGTAASLENWTQAGPGGFTHVDCELESSGGLSMLWYGAEVFESYTLRLDWKFSTVVYTS